MDWSRCYFVTSEIYNNLQILLWAFAYYYLVRDFVQKKKTALLTGFTYLAVMLILWYVPYYLSSFSAENFPGMDILCRSLAGGTDCCHGWFAVMEGMPALEFGIYRCGEGILSVFDRECDRSSYGDSIDSHGIGTDCEDILR